MLALLTEKQLDKKVYRPYHMDGTEDLMAGVVLFYCGAALQRSPVMFTLIFAVIIVTFLRRFVTYPRVGYVVPAMRPLGVRLGLWLAGSSAFAAIVSEALLVIASRYPQSAIAQLFPPPVLQYFTAACLVLTLIGMGLQSRMPRWFAYAALALALACIAPAVRWDPLDGTAVAGLVIGIAGAVLLLRFVRKHPVLSDEAQISGSKTEAGQ